MPRPSRLALSDLASRIIREADAAEARLGLDAQPMTDAGAEAFVPPAYRERDEEPRPAWLRSMR